MEQYISKSALVAEIEKIRRIEVTNNDVVYNGALDEIRFYIDTLEVREVDLGKELSTYLEMVKATNEDIDFVDFAKHFFELGLSVSNKAQKGEEV